jgi:hypothetical protein
MTYERTNAEYAATYETTERTIRRWREVGHPLDDPDGMEPIIDAMRTRRGVSKTSPKRRTQAQPEADSFQFTENGLGLPAAIQRFREIEKLSADRFAENPADMNRFAIWIQSTEQLRKVEKDNPAIARDNESTIDKADAEAKWAEACAAVRSALDAVPQRMAKQLEGLDAVSIKEKLKAEMNVVFGILVDPSRVRTEDVV